MTLWESFRRQSVAARREMVKSGMLTSRDEFRARLGISVERLAQMIHNGSIFEINVDGASYIPALLADKAINLRRLHSVCRILFPAPPASRLNYLLTRHRNLGGVSPIDALAGSARYRWLRQMAWAWASEWSMTTVRIFPGDIHEATGLQPLYTAALKIDPRANLWKRVVKAITQGGYIDPRGPYPYIKSTTIFVTRSSGARTKPVTEARFALRIIDGIAHVAIDMPDGNHAELKMSVGGSSSVVDVVHRIAAYEHRATSR